MGTFIKKGMGKGSNRFKKKKGGSGHVYLFIPLTGGKDRRGPSATGEEEQYLYRKRMTNYSASMANTCAKKEKCLKAG